MQLIWQMPLALAHTWTETEERVFVNVTRPMGTSTAPDIFATDAMVKVNFPPYLFMVDLFGDVDEAQGKAKVRFARMLIANSAR